MTHPQNNARAAADQRESIADALEKCDWSNTSIGNKSIIKAAVSCLRRFEASLRPATETAKAVPDSLRAMSEKASPGPSAAYKFCGAKDSFFAESRVMGDEAPKVFGAKPIAGADALFIVAAVNFVRDLLATPSPAPAIAKCPECGLSDDDTDGCANDFHYPEVAPAVAEAVEPAPHSKRAEANNGCWAKALDDEPMFIILGRDPDGANIVRLWALRRSAAGDPGHGEPVLALADAMDAWRAAGHVSTSAPAPEAYPSLAIDEAIAAERERCAKVAEEFDGQCRGYIAGFATIATAIRQGQNGGEG